MNPRQITLEELGGWHVLNKKDLEELNEGSKRVFMLLRDNEWHTREEICAAAGKNGAYASEGLRRARELRQKGYTLEKKRVVDARQWLYRLKIR